MDCAFVARQRVFVANRPEDLAHYPLVTSDEDNMHVATTLTFTAQQCTLTTDSVAAAALTTSEESLSPGSSTTSSTNQRTCRCVIDLSTRETMHRDFYNWLQGNEPQSVDRPCISDDPAFLHLSDNNFQQPSTSTDSSLHFYSTTDDHPSDYYFDSQNVNIQIKIEPAEPDDQKECVEKKQEPEVKPKKKRGGSNRGTNLYGRAYCPGRPLSMDERYQIICLFQAGMKVNAISKQLCISHGCVSKIITRFRETGLLIPSSHAECRRRKRLMMEAAAQQQNLLNNG